MAKSQKKHLKGCRGIKAAKKIALEEEWCLWTPEVEEREQMERVTHQLELDQEWSLDGPESEADLTDDSEEEKEETLKLNTTVFDTMFMAAKSHDDSKVHFKHQRESTECIRTKQRRQEKATKLRQSVHDKKGNLTTHNIAAMFKSVASQAPRPTNPPSHRYNSDFLPKPTYEELSLAIADLQKRFQKRVGIQGQNRVRHEAVLAFLKAQKTAIDKSRPEPRIQIATKVSRYGFDRDIYFARKIVKWELEWRRFRQIPEGKKGCFAKTRSWFNDEGVELAVREYIASAGEAVTAGNIAKVVGDYLSSDKAVSVLNQLLRDAEEKEKPQASVRMSIKIRTARKWMRKRMGLRYQKITKHVYFDGHEREDVVKFRNEVFLPKLAEFEPRIAVFNEDGTFEKPKTLQDGEELVIPITHDESIFHANDGRRAAWLPEGKMPIRPKNQGKGLMVSGFLSPVGILQVPDSVPDSVLLADPFFPRNKDNCPIRSSMHIHEYGKDNYWTSEKMIAHTIEVAIPIFRYAFPGCRALFLFDNASNHCAFADNALVARRLNREPGGKQPHMKDGFIHNLGRPQPMSFPPVMEIDDPHYKHRGLPKGAEVLLKERGLFYAKRKGQRLLLQCPKDSNRKGCDYSNTDGCCMRQILANQPDFKSQKGKLEEEIVARNHFVLFYPKFHCELNWIERFWCACKHFARNNCKYDLPGLRLTIPQSFASVSTASIFHYYDHCMRLVRTYRDNDVSYGSKEFAKRTVQYKVHRRVEDRFKD